MHKPFTLRTPNADELGIYQAMHSASPYVVVTDHLKKGKFDILGIFAICSETEDIRYFSTNLTHRGFGRARFDVFGSTYLHDATGTYKVIDV